MNKAWTLLFLSILSSTVGVSQETHLPRGSIIIWYGTENTVPTGWAICNGHNGTPDLRDRFVIGSGAHHPQGTIGGQKAVTPVVTVHDHVLTLAQIPSHNHGGKTSIEENESIGYNLFAPKPVGTHVPIYDEGGHWYNTRRATQEKSMVHTHTIHSEGHNQPHSHHATASGINLTPPYYALLYIMKL